jgi:hypothetical protein
MTDNQEQIRQHWQELAEQLGLDAPALDAPPAASSIPPASSKEEPALSVSPSSKSETQEESAEDRGWKMEDRGIEAEAGSMDESSPESGASLEPMTEAPPEAREEPRGRQRGRRERGGDRGERSSRSRRGSAPRRREAERIRDESNSDHFEEPESKEPGEFSEEVEPTILHDSSVVEREKEEEDIDDVDTLSDWNVPSWTELIESLYRPER